MSLASWSRIGLAVMLALCTPLIGFAALDVGVDSSGKEKANAQDACKSGTSKTEAGKGKTISGGDNRTQNYISIAESSGEIQVTCRRLQIGEPALVTFCDLEHKCWSVDKNSKEGKNLMRMYDSAYEGGTPMRSVAEGENIFGTRRIDSRALLENMLPRDQMTIIDEKIIGKVDERNRLYEYSHIVDWAAWSSSGSSQPYDSFESAAIKQIEAMANLGREPQPDLYSDLPINIDPSIQRDWKKPNRVDFLPIWQNAEVMNGLFERQKNNANLRVQSTFEDLRLPPLPPLVLASSPPSNSDTTSFTPKWFTRTYNSFINFLFGR